MRSRIEFPGAGENLSQNQSEFKPRARAVESHSEGTRARETKPTRKLTTFAKKSKLRAMKEEVKSRSFAMS